MKRLMKLYDNIRKRLHNIGNAAFYTGIVIELMVMMTDHMSSWTLPYRGRFTHVAFILFGIKILLNRYSKKEWMVTVLLGTIGCISYYTSGDEWVIRAVMMVVAAKDIDNELTNRLCLWISAIGTAVIVTLAILGITGQLADVRDYGRGGIETRWCLGFNHANNVHCMLWYLMALYMIQKRKRDVHVWEYAILMAIDAGLFILTGSKTGLAATGLLVLGCMICDLVKKAKASIVPYIIGALMVAVCMGLTIYGSSVSIYDDPVCAVLNNILTQRLNMCYMYANLSDWKIFAMPVDLGVAIDNGIASMIISYGVVVAAVFLLVLIYVIYLSYRRQDTKMLMVCVSFLFVWFMESTFGKNESLLCTIVFILLFDKYRVVQSSAEGC